MASWGNQFSKGDQGCDRDAFYESSCRTCPKCASTKIGNEKYVAGCRHNGDGYGTEVYTCQQCGWITSFQYDEAGESYFYEMRRYAPAAQSTPTYAPLTPEEKDRFRISLRWAPKTRVRDMMILHRFNPAEVDAFLEKCPSGDPDPTPPS